MINDLTNRVVRLEENQRKLLNNYLQPAAGPTIKPTVNATTDKWKAESRLQGFQSGYLDGQISSLTNDISALRLRLGDLTDRVVKLEQALND